MTKPQQAQQPAPLAPHAAPFVESCRSGSLVSRIERPPFPEACIQPAFLARRRSALFLLSVAQTAVPRVQPQSLPRLGVVDLPPRLRRRKGVRAAPPPPPAERRCFRRE